MRAAAAWILACLAGFVVLESVATCLYPGGTFWDRTACGARFWQNYVCDLEAPVAIDGRLNTAGSRFAVAAMLTMAVAFVPFWSAVPALFGARARLGRWTRLFGLLSLVGIAGAALLPSSRFGALHGAAVAVAALPALAAAALAVVGLASAEHRPRIVAAIGALLVIVAAADFVMYARTFVAGGPGPKAIPAVQKAALVLLLAWMAAVAVRLAAATPARELVRSVRSGAPRRRARRGPRRPAR